MKDISLAKEKQTTNETKKRSDNKNWEMLLVQYLYGALVRMRVCESMFVSECLFLLLIFLYLKNVIYICVHIRFQIKLTDAMFY